MPSLPSGAGTYGEDHEHRPCPRGHRALVPDRARAALARPRAPRRAGRPGRRPGDRRPRGRRPHVELVPAHAGGAAGRRRRVLPQPVGRVRRRPHAARPDPRGRVLGWVRPDAQPVPGAPARDQSLRLRRAGLVRRHRAGEGDRGPSAGSRRRRRAGAQRGGGGAGRRARLRRGDRHGADPGHHHLGRVHRQRSTRSPPTGPRPRVRGSRCGSSVSSANRWSGPCRSRPTRSRRRGRAGRRRTSTSSPPTSRTRSCACATAPPTSPPSARASPASTAGTSPSRTSTTTSSGSRTRPGSSAPVFCCSRPRCSSPRSCSSGRPSSAPPTPVRTRSRRCGAWGWRRGTWSGASRSPTC